MIQKVIGIIANSTYVTDENMLNKGCGGTETWIINIACELSKKNYHVVVFANISYHHIYNNVEFLPISYFQNKCCRQHFDSMIFVRYFNKYLLNIIKNEQCCNNIWFVAHDIFLWKVMGRTSMSYKDDILSDDFLSKTVKGLCVMSEWHRDINSKYWPTDKIKIIGNGLNFSDFDDNLVNNEIRDNNIFWSSCHERGFDIFAKHIAPHIIKQIPDFTIYYSSYDLNDFADYSNYPYIKCLGNFNKKDLYKEMCKHKVMFLPMTKWETFCITILEQGYCNVEIICPYSTGIQTSMKIFKELLLDPNIKYDENRCKEVADIIVNKILNYSSVYTKSIRKIIHNYIKETYSWENITNILIKTIL